MGKVKQWRSNLAKVEEGRGRERKEEKDGKSEGIIQSIVAGGTGGGG